MHETQFQCPECGLHYKDSETTKQCADWCKAHQSCNLEITKAAVENQKQEKP